MPWVLTQDTPRQDILIRRGVSEKFGVLWEEDDGTGAGFQPVDLTAWSCVLRIASPMGEMWAEMQAIPGSNGVVSVEIAADALMAPEWAARGSGQWSLTASLGDRVERLADGNYYLEI